VRFALTFSLPVFITPPAAKRQVDCVVERVAERLRARCGNTGNAYAYLRGVVLQSPGGQVVAHAEQGNYVLPEVRRGFELKRVAGPVPAGRYRLQVTFDDNVQQAFDAVLPD
jgi:fimbrial chaperone protein